MSGVTITCQACDWSATSGPGDRGPVGLLLGHWREHGFEGRSPAVAVGAANACAWCDGWGTRVMVLPDGRAREVPCEPCDGTGERAETGVAG